MAGSIVLLRTICDKIENKALSPENFETFSAEVLKQYRADPGLAAPVMKQLGESPPTLIELKGVLSRLGYHHLNSLLSKHESDETKRVIDANPELKEKRDMLDAMQESADDDARMNLIREITDIEAEARRLEDFHPFTPTVEQKRKAPVHDFLLQAYQEHLVLQEGLLPKYVANHLQIDEYSQDNERFSVRMMDGGDKLTSLWKSLMAESHGKDSYSQGLAQQYLQTCHEPDPRRSTARDVFYRTEVARCYLKFMESVAEDVGISGNMQIAVDEIYKNISTELLQSPLNIVDMIQQKTLSGLSHERSAVFSRALRDHLTAASKYTGLDIPAR